MNDQPTRKGDTMNGKFVWVQIFTAIVVVFGFVYTNAKDPYRLTLLENRAADVESRLRATELSIALTQQQLEQINTTIREIRDILRKKAYE